MPEVGAEARVFGWSRGYLDVGIEWPQGDSKPSIINVWGSSDGLTWQQAATIHTSRGVNDVTVVEGPKGLVLGGSSGGCAGPAYLQEMWVSTDGVSWTEVAWPFGKASLIGMSAGSSGYIVNGNLGSSPAVWTSRDARRWSPSRLTGPEFAGAIVQSTAAFGPGFALVGATLELSQSCQLATAVGAAWFSRDGVSWKKVAVPGALSAPALSSRLIRLDDHTLLLTEDRLGQDAWWISRDGTTWSRLPESPGSCDAVASGGRYGYCLAWREGAHFYDIWQLDGTRAVELWQTERPAGNGSVALGPAGLLAVGDPSRSWLGVPVGS